jgi:hypothetical protein
LNVTLSLTPDHRFQTVKELVAVNTPPADSTMLALWEVLRNEGKDQSVIYAFEIYSTYFEREVMQAWIISRATDAQINDALRIPVAVSEVYRKLFFDLEAFRDELALLTWLRSYEKTRQGSDTGIALMKKGLAGGPSALAWIYSRGEVALDPQHVMQHVMAEAYFRGKTGRAHALNAKETLVAHQFMATALKAAGQITKVDRVATDINELRIKLQHRELTTSIEDAEEGEILH